MNSDTQNRTFCLLTAPSKWKCASSKKPNIVEWYLIILSPFIRWHSLTFILNCKFTQHCYSVWTQFKSLFNNHHTECLDIPSRAAAFLVDLIRLLCSGTLDCINVLQRMHRWSPGVFPLQQWTIIIKSLLTVLNKGTQPHLHCFRHHSTVSQPSWVNWHELEECDTSTLRKSKK
jgi:hypothetical protein